MEEHYARSQTVCGVCCGGLCQHPECWRSNIQQVRDAVWKRNGVTPNEDTVNGDSSVKKDRNVNPIHGHQLPTLKIVDVRNDHLMSQNTIKKVHRRSSSLPCVSSAVSKPSPPHSPRHSPALSSPPLNEYQGRLKWKKHFSNSLQSVASSSVKLSTIGLHELYGEDELDQEWQEVYVSSAYLVWCPSTKKGRRAKKSKSNDKSFKTQNNNIIPKDVTEDLVPASLEQIKESHPKSTKTPTGGQPFSPFKPATNPVLYQYGLEDLSDLPKPVLSGILKRINWRSTDVSPNQDEKLPMDDKEEDELTKREGSKVLLAVDINSRLPSPGNDTQIVENTAIAPDNIATSKSIVDTSDEEKCNRKSLSMHPIGLPIDDLPKTKYYHCTNSIPRRMSLGIALEPVNLVPITPSPIASPKQASPQEDTVQNTKDPLVVTVPSGRPDSAPVPASFVGVSDQYEDIYYVNSAFRYTPSPVRAPASTPISPDKYAEYARYSRSSRRRSSVQDEQLYKSMKRWNTLCSINDYRDKSSPVEEEELEYNNQRTAFEQRENVFITQGVVHDMYNLIPPTPKGRSPSPGSRTCIPKDIIEQFQGDIYGKRHELPTTNPAPHVGAGIFPPGWRQPRSRTPIQISETPARYPPRPRRQPPQESIPKSLRITSLPKPLKRPKSTPPRCRSQSDMETVPMVLSESSLVNQVSGMSMEVQPSSSITGSGSIPPPPSPEAMLTLKNDANLTLETVCEEDERSSKTSIDDVLKKNVTLSRLSPLGSEMSEESVDLPIEDQSSHQALDNNDKRILNRESPREATLGSFRQIAEDGKLDHQPKRDIGNISTLENTKDHTPENGGLGPQLSRDLINSERSLDQTPENGGLGPEPVRDLMTSERSLDQTQENGGLGPQPSHDHMTSERSLDQTQENGGLGPQPARDLMNSERSLNQTPENGGLGPQPARDLINSDRSLDQISDEEQSKQRLTSYISNTSPLEKSPLGNEMLEIQSSKETEALRENLTDIVHQPPVSPDLSSVHDFTDGIDMGLDLAAELQAAMECLGDMDIEEA